MRRLAAIGILTLASVALAAPAAHAAGKKKGRLILNGAFGPTSIDFSESRKFTEFVEEGTIDTAYKSDPGPGFEVGVQYNFFKSLGAAVSFSILNRDQSASYDAALPHPFFFDRDRTVTGDLSGLSYKETAVHVDLVLTGSSGSVDFSVFAGGTFFKVESDLVEPIQYRHSYPYDTVTVTSVPTAAFEDSPVGFNVGGSVDLRIGGSFGVGAQVRFSRGSAELVPAQGQTVKIDAGGLQVAGGLRIYF